MLVFYGCRYEFCRSDNCFSLYFVNIEDVFVILKIELMVFYLLIGVILFGLWYFGFCIYMFSWMIVVECGKNCLKRCIFFCLNIVVLLFIFYGIIVIDGVLYFNDEDEIFLVNYLCWMGCFYEELYFLLFIFFVYVVYFIK